MIYGINNDSLTDVGGPGEESGCGPEGIVSLLGGGEGELFPQVSYRGSNEFLQFAPDGLAVRFKHAPCRWLVRCMVLTMLPTVACLPAAVQPHAQATQVTCVW